MTILLFFYDNLRYLLFLLFFMYVILWLVNNYKTRVKKYLEQNNGPYAKEQFLKYLDRYYVKNKYYTFFAVTLYIFFQSMWVILYRIVYYNGNIKKHHDTVNLDYALFNINAFIMLKIVFFIILLFIMVIIFKLLLDKLFFEEVLKLHFYLLQFKTYSKLKHYLSGYYLLEFWGKIYLFFYTTSLSKDKHLDTSEEFYDFYEYKYIYHNKTILRLSKWLISLAEKNIIVHIIINTLTQVFRWLYRNMLFDGLVYYIPYILLTITMGLPFIIGHTWYVNSLFIAAYLLVQLNNCIKFYQKRHPVYDRLIARYFYVNDTNYENQRILLMKNLKKFQENMYNSIQNKSLLHYMKDNSENNIVSYILHDCLTDISTDLERNRIRRKFNGMHRRYYLMIIIFFFMYYIIGTKSKYTITLFNSAISLPISYIIVTMGLLLCYFATNIYISKKTNLHDSIKNYVYNPLYNVLFWILFLIILYLFWILLIKANIFLISDGILWEYAGFRITRNYTVEEKLVYYYEYFYNILYILHENPSGNKMIKTLLDIEELLNWKDFITETTTISETKQYIEALVNCYFEQLTLHLEKIKLAMEKARTEELEYLARRRQRDTLGRCIANIASLWTFSKFFVMYLKATHVIMNVPSREALRLTRLFFKILYRAKTRKVVDVFLFIMKFYKDNKK